MSPQAFIFIGRSGCGKGTQVDLLMKVLKEKEPTRDILYIQTGKEFRNFIQGPNETQTMSKKINDVGGLQPEFLAIAMWVRPLVDEYKKGEHLIFDGTPRKYDEAGVLDSIFNFYGFKKPIVVNIEISPEESLKRLLLRKRLDDNEEDIKKRLAWYETDVVPTIDFYRNNPNYNFIEVPGERSIEEIHADMMNRLGLD